MGESTYRRGAHIKSFRGTQFLLPLKTLGVPGQDIRGRFVRRSPRSALGLAHLTPEELLIRFPGHDIHPGSRNGRLARPGIDHGGATILGMGDTLLALLLLLG